MGDQHQLLELIAELHKLSQQFGVVLSACGCCDGFNIKFEGHEEPTIKHIRITPDDVYVEEACYCDDWKDDVCEVCKNDHCKSCTGRSICLTCLYNREVTSEERRFYVFRQNNSFGEFLPPAIVVLIEASSAKQANSRARKLGLYFNGVMLGKDCRCCGDRWCEASELEWANIPEVPDSIELEEGTWESLKYAKIGFGTLCVGTTDLWGNTPVLAIVTGDGKATYYVADANYAKLVKKEAVQNG